MDVIAEIYSLLEEKKTKFTQYEQSTQDMLHCEVANLGNYIIKRGELANEIDELSGKIEQICLKEPNGEFYAKLSYAQVSFEKVPLELQPLFELGQQVRSVMARIQKMEPQVVQRLESLKSEAFQKIKENHNLPKIKKYLTNLGEQPSTGNFTSTKI